MGAFPKLGVPLQGDIGVYILGYIRIRIQKV